MMVRLPLREDLLGTDFTLWLLSLMVGLLVGLTSMGGAALMTPLLILVFGVRPMLAVGTDLAYGAITKIAGAMMHFRQGTVDMKVAFRLACGSIPAGVLGVLTVSGLHRIGIDADQWIRRLLGWVLMIVAATILARCFYGPMKFSSTAFASHERSMTIVWGAFVGFLVGLTSVGSGSLLAPFLLMLFPNNPSRAVGTDVFHAAILVSATAFFHVQGGNVDWHLVPILLAGSVPGVLVGSYLAPKLPGRTLRFSLGAVLLATGLKLA